MASTLQLALPNDRFRLEEINMPEDLASALAGQRVDVEVLPEEPPATRRIDLDDPPPGLPVLIDPGGAAWNDYWPIRVLYRDAGGRAWRLPRHWLSDGVSPVVEASRYEVSPMNCAGGKSGVRRRGGTCAT
jgi:hypothetical protein